MKVNIYDNKEQNLRIKGIEYCVFTLAYLNEELTLE